LKYPYLAEAVYILYLLCLKKQIIVKPSWFEEIKKTKKWMIQNLLMGFLITATGGANGATLQAAAGSLTK
jgi:hypothetical protein